MAPSNKSPSDQDAAKKSGLKTEHLLLGALFLGLGFYWLKGRNAVHPMPAETAPKGESAVTKGSQVEILSNSDSKLDTKKYQEELNRSRAQFARARALGLKSLEFKDSGDTVSIPLIFSPKKIWCQGGDLDTMRYAAKAETSKEFVISLEAIGRPGKHPFVRVSLKELYAGLKYTFSVPRPKESIAYGLFICSDNKQDNSCQRKNAKTHAELSAQLAQDPNRAKSIDQIFYFQNLILDAKKLESYRSNEFGADFQKSIGSHLNKKGINAADFQTAWKLNSTIKSSPSDIRAGKIVLSLPYNDPRCTLGTVAAGKTK